VQCERDVLTAERRLLELTPPPKKRQAVGKEPGVKKGLCHIKSVAWKPRDSKRKSWEQKYHISIQTLEHYTLGIRKKRKGGT
jgi:hypothetical protein